MSQYRHLRLLISRAKWTTIRLKTVKYLYIQYIQDKFQPEQASDIYAG